LGRDHEDAVGRTALDCRYRQSVDAVLDAVTFHKEGDDMKAFFSKAATVIQGFATVRTAITLASAASVAVVGYFSKPHVEAYLNAPAVEVAAPVEAVQAVDVPMDASRLQLIEDAIRDIKTVMSVLPKGKDYDELSIRVKKLEEMHKKNNHSAPVKPSEIVTGSIPQKKK
jgi:hypothetical protein